MGGKITRRGQFGLVEVVGAAIVQMLLGDLRGTRHQPATGDHSGQEQVRYRSCQGCLRIAVVIGQQPLRGLFELGQRRAKLLSDVAQLGILGQFIHRGANPGSQCGGGDTGMTRLILILGQLTANQIIGLNRRCAFVNRRDARIAHVLAGAGFFDETHTTVDLNPGRGNFDTAFGTPAFDHRRQEIDHGLRFLGLGGIVVVVGMIHLGRDPIGECPHRFGP